MTIEFNGRVVAAFVFGMVCGAAGLVLASASQVGRIQRERDVLRVERDSARATSERQDAEIRQLRLLIQSATTTAAPHQFDGYDALNVVRPGLGTVAKAIAKSVPQTPAPAPAPVVIPSCPEGSTPQTDSSWQGYRCVAENPQ